MTAPRNREHRSGTPRSVPSEGRVSGAARPWLRGVVGTLGLLASFAFAGPSLACPVCIDLPEKTLADRLLEAETVVVAREDPDRPFRFLPIRTLVGATEGRDIPFLLDSATRRRLESAPDDGVLMMRSHGGDWSRGPLADEDLRRVAPLILELRGAGETRDDARFAFFDELLHHPNPQLRRAAVDELSRVRYGLIRSLKRPVDGASARRALADRTAVPWAPFYILMLGLSDDEQDAVLVR